MNQTEYILLSKEDIFKMYENVCEELERLEKILENVESEYSSLQGEFEACTIVVEQLEEQLAKMEG